ncbi:MAG: hypothetical protein ACK5XL_11680, partial [Cyclobacteriaceae bacterium]
MIATAAWRKDTSENDINTMLLVMFPRPSVTAITILCARPLTRSELVHPKKESPQPWSRAFRIFNRQSIHFDQLN